MRLNRLLCLSVIGGMLLAGCGSGDDTPVNAPAPFRTVTGNVSKGPLSGATVRAFDIDSRGRRAGPALAETTTDSSGNWSMDLPADSGELLIESSGGRYVDEADPEPNPGARRMVQLGPDDSFAAVLPAGSSSVSINLYTDALLRKSRYETQGENFFAVYALNRSFMTTAFGFDIVTVLPTDPIRPDNDASVEARQYAMAIGGAANAVNAMTVANQEALPSFPIISGLIDDLTDCTIDGQSVAGPVTGVATVMLDLNIEILRFRNNNHSAYAATPLLQIDQAACASSGQLPDVIAPVFIDFPGDFSVESADGAPVSASLELVQAALAQIRAIDDRDGAVAFSSDLPAVLPIGPTLVSFTAADAAGNTGTASLTITVMPPEAPAIVAPPDIVTKTSGELTPVNLGLPTVSDNVTPIERLVVSNDAPPNGFARGEYLVTWTVTDGIGLSAMAVQQVNVGTEPGYNGDEITPGDTLLPTFPGETPIGPIPGPRMDPAAEGPGDAAGPAAGSVHGSGPDPSAGAGGPSQIVQVPAGQRDRVYSFPGTTPGRPVIVLFAPGRHTGSVRLVAPCDHVALVGPAELTGIDGPALAIEGCRGVRLDGLTLSHSVRGALLATDTEMTIVDSGFLHNAARRGAAIRAVRSELRIERTTMANNSAAFAGGAIWMDDVSTAVIRDSVFRENYAIAGRYHGERLILSNVTLDDAAIAVERPGR